MNPRDPILLTYSGGGGRNWLTRALVTTLGLALVLVFAVAAFFFLTVALIVGTFLVAIIAVRLWWVMRRIRAQREAAGPLEGEYTTVNDSAHGQPNGRRRSNDPY
jgi:predicted lipid-binding transport protein (Tim44 family)